MAKAIACACGCGKLFIPSTQGQKYALPFHDPELLERRRRQAFQYAKSKGLQDEAAEDFAGDALVSILRGWKQDFKHMFCDFVRAQPGATRDGRELPQHLHLEQPVKSGSTVTLAELLEAPPIQSVEDLPSEAVERVIARSSPRVQEMVRLRDQGLTNKQLGVLFGITEARVSQLFNNLNRYYRREQVALVKRRTTEVIRHAEAQNLDPIQIDWIKL